jgi:hypothetical protein
MSYLSVCLSVCLYVCLSVCLYVCLCVYLSECKNSSSSDRPCINATGLCERSVDLPIQKKDAVSFTRTLVMSARLHGVR